MASRQDCTKEAYENPQIVESYIKRNAYSESMVKERESFVARLSGRKIVDIGCGPGQETYHFAELGCDVIGLDYSSEMIKAAKKFKKTANPPRFMVADMRNIDNLFPEDAFDGAWANASLLHIPEEEIPQVLNSIHQIVKNGGKVFVSLKGGKQGAQMLREEGKASIPVEREFIFWEEEKFSSVAREHGFAVEKIAEARRGVTDNKPTSWIIFILEVQK